MRALAKLYNNTTACVRGDQGLNDIFQIDIGTRERGIENPLLYTLFVANLISYLDEVRHLDGWLLLDGKRTSAFQFADDLALIAYPVGDMNRLLSRW